MGSPLSFVTAISQRVDIAYDAKLSVADRTLASDKVARAADLINQKISSFTAEEKNAILQIAKFTVSGSDAALGATGRHEMTLSIGYIKSSSSDWIGSLFGHEGQHCLNFGKYAGDERWKDEQSASRTQLAIGRKIGFSQNDISYLEKWADDGNRDAMQRHMSQKFLWP